MSLIRKVLGLVAGFAVVAAAASDQWIVQVGSGTLVQRRLAAQELGLDVNNAAAATPALIAALRDKDAYVRTVAIRSLTRLKAQAAVPAIKDALQSDKNEEVRQTAVLALPSLDPTGASAALSGALSDSSEAVRATAVGALGSLKDAASMAALIARCQDSSALVRHRVAAVLGSFGDPSADPALIKLLQDTDGGVRGTAVLALGDLKATEAKAALVPLLQDPEKLVRAATARSLAMLGDTEGRAVSLGFLSDSGRAVRLLAIEGVGWMNDRSLVSALKPLTNDKDVYIQSAAKDAINRLMTRPS